MLVIHECDGSWAIHRLDTPSVRLSKAEMTALAERFWRVPSSLDRAHSVCYYIVLLHVLPNSPL